MEEIIALALLLPLYLALEGCSHTHEDYFDSGVAKYEKGDYKGAIQDYTKAIKFKPNYAEAYGNRGTAKGRLGDYRGAIEDYSKAIELNPNYAQAYYNRGVARLGIGQKDSGCLDLSKAGELGFEKAHEAVMRFSACW